MRRRKRRGGAGPAAPKTEGSLTRTVADGEVLTRETTDGPIRIKYLRGKRDRVMLRIAAPLSVPIRREGRSPHDARE